MNCGSEKIWVTNTNTTLKLCISDLSWWLSHILLRLLSSSSDSCSNNLLPDLGSDLSKAREQAAAERVQQSSLSRAFFPAVPRGLYPLSLPQLSAGSSDIGSCGGSFHRGWGKPGSAGDTEPTHGQPTSSANPGPPDPEKDPGPTLRRPAGLCTPVWIPRGSLESPGGFLAGGKSQTDVQSKEVLHGLQAGHGAEGRGEEKAPSCRISLAHESQVRGQMCLSSEVQGLVEAT